MPHTTYVFYSPNHKRYYIGHTNNLELRLKQHNDSESGWTKSYRPWIVIYKNSHKARVPAMREEKYLKSLKNKERIRQYIAG